MDELNHAIALYFRHIPLRVGAAPQVFEAEFGAAAGPLVVRIEALTAEAFAVPVDWANDLAQCGDVVEAALLREHPELSEESARRIANYWSYCNR